MLVSYLRFVGRTGHFMLGKMSSLHSPASHYSYIMPHSRLSFRTIERYIFHGMFQNEDGSVKEFHGMLKAVKIENPLISNRYVDSAKPSVCC